MYNQNQKVSQNFLIPFNIEMLAFKKLSLTKHTDRQIFNQILSGLSSPLTQEFFIEPTTRYGCSTETALCGPHTDGRET